MTSWLLLQAADVINRLTCVLRGHRWSSFGDEDEDGWFHDTGGHADCMTRSCVRCNHIECRPRQPWEG